MEVTRPITQTDVTNRWWSAYFVKYVHVYYGYNVGWSVGQ